MTSIECSVAREMVPFEFDVKLFHFEIQCFVKSLKIYQIISVVWFSFQKCQLLEKQMYFPLIPLAAIV